MFDLQKETPTAHHLQRLQENWSLNILATGCVLKLFLLYQHQFWHCLCFFCLGWYLKGLHNSVGQAPPRQFLVIAGVWKILALAASLFLQRTTLLEGKYWLLLFEEVQYNASNKEVHYQTGRPGYCFLKKYSTIFWPRSTIVMWKYRSTGSPLLQSDKVPITEEGRGEEAERRRDRGIIWWKVKKSACSWLHFWSTCQGGTFKPS